MADGLRSFLGAWEEYCFESEEIRELDADRVLVLTCPSGRGKTSGLEVEEMRAKGAGLFHIRGGKVIRPTNYLDRERTLPDLGLAAEGDAA